MGQQMENSLHWGILLASQTSSSHKEVIEPFIFFKHAVLHWPLSIGRDWISSIPQGALSAYKSAWIVAALNVCIYFLDHPSAETLLEDLGHLHYFDGVIHMHNSATATFYTPSDLCGSGSLLHEWIQSAPSFHGGHCWDTVFVEVDATILGMCGMEIAHILLFFSFHNHHKDWACALIDWFVHSKDMPDLDTGTWTVHLECDNCRQAMVQVIAIDSITHGTDLLPVYGQTWVPEHFDQFEALDMFKSFFVNHFVDHHMHELISGWICR